MLSAFTTWALYVIYMGALILFGIFVWWKEKNNTTRHFYTAGNTINWFVLCMTYIAALMSTWVFFAGPGGYYRGGFGYYMSELSYIPLFPVLTYFVMNKVWLLNTQRHYTTQADIFVDRFRSPTLRLILAIVFFCVSMPYAAAIYIACGKAATVATNGAITQSSAVIFVGLTALLFIPFGGVKSVAWAATVQAWIFMVALWSIGICAIAYGFGGDVFGAAASVWENTNSWFSYPGPEKWVPYSARFGYPIACAIGWTIMLPDVFIRAGYFGKDMQTQRSLMFLQPVLQTIVWTGTMFIGFAAIAMLPGLKGGDTELVIPLLLTKIISPESLTVAMVLMAVFVWGTLAKGLSAATSHLLVAGSIVSEDILTRLLNLKVSPNVHITIARLAVVGLGIAALWLALNPPDLMWTLIMFAIALVMPIFPVLVAALYWRRATAPAAIVASVTGVIGVLLTYYYGLGDSWYGVFGMLASAVLMVVVSYLTEETSQEVLDDFYGALAKAEAEYYEN
ncbi:sodium:solute symporter family protein [Sporomusa acidovorans]|uniref:Sodium/pantothenate symporter n=1 Tax=Sporomusa acidovorans (strain ATCC 49682 / DSM 3132 / Mol) TaxID=1123286 RepID=A0ABZ3J960_SPOA4|nr:sodium:solute symporter family protein [Sporomusa acidovorans]OZC16714.1 sodium/pantothenate symporter [Sporomusa acidovorans DSM 3132]SDE05009.1 Na+/proline symporter [Sporomusa acidovorans]